MTQEPSGPGQPGTALPWVCEDEGRLMNGTGTWMITTGTPDWRLIAEFPIPIHDIPWSHEDSEKNVRYAVHAANTLPTLEAENADLKRRVEAWRKLEAVRIVQAETAKGIPWTSPVRLADVFAAAESVLHDLGERSADGRKQ